MRGTGKHDPALTRYWKGLHRLKLVFWDGSSLHQEPLRSIRTFDFVMEDGRVIDKITCIGVFPVDGDDLILSRAHPVLEIKKSPKDRVNVEKINGIHHEMVGSRLRVILVNGWELEGFLVFLTPYQIVIKGRPHAGISLFRHAVADFEVLSAPQDTPEGIELLKKHAEERAREAALAARPPFNGKAAPPRREGGHPRPKRPAARAPQAMQLSAAAIKAPPLSSGGPLPAAEAGLVAHPAPPLARPASSRPDPSIWTKLLPLKAERTVVDAKIKLVLTEVSMLREVGDLYWLPLTNQPKDVAGGVELSATPLDILIPKKMWRRAQEKADTLKAESGVDPVYLIEAPIGIQQNRLAAVVGSIQVMSGKTDAPPSNL